MLPVVLVDIPQRQGQMTQHLKLSPPGQLQNAVQIAVDDTIIIRFVTFFNIVQVHVAKLFSTQVHGPDDKIHRCTVHHMDGPVKAVLSVAQLRPQPQGDPVPPQGLGLPELAPGLVPVKIPPGTEIIPVQGVHMVGDTQLIKALPDGGLRRLGHGLVSVRGAGGMYVIIGKVHGSSASFSVSPRVMSLISCSPANSFRSCPRPGSR